MAQFSVATARCLVVDDDPQVRSAGTHFDPDAVRAFSRAHADHGVLPVTV